MGFPTVGDFCRPSLRGHLRDAPMFKAKPTFSHPYKNGGGSVRHTLIQQSPI